MSEEGNEHECLPEGGNEVYQGSMCVHQGVCMCAFEGLNS